MVSFCSSDWGNEEDLHFRCSVRRGKGGKGGSHGTSPKVDRLPGVVSGNSWVRVQTHLNPTKIRDKDGNISDFYDKSQHADTGRVRTKMGGIRHNKMMAHFHDSSNSDIIIKIVQCMEIFISMEKIK